VAQIKVSGKSHIPIRTSQDVADLKRNDLKIVPCNQCNRIENFSDAAETAEKSQPLWPPE
jgi:hypothetical protein